MSQRSDGIAKHRAMIASNKQRFLKLNPSLNNLSGIYFLTREDEEGFKYAYIGQSKHILTRLAEHMIGYQHIDLSLKKHKLYSKEDNPYGWNANCINYPEDELDKQEQYWIKKYASFGYQLRNKTAGSQGVGKVKINDYKPSRTYNDGLVQGYKNAIRDINYIIDKHLQVGIKEELRNNKVSQKQFEKFKNILKGEFY